MVSLSPLKWIPRIKIPPSVGAAFKRAKRQNRNASDGVKYLIALIFMYVHLHVFVYMYYNKIFKPLGGREFIP